MQISKKENQEPLTKIIRVGLPTNAYDGDSDDDNPKFHRRPFSTNFAFACHNQWFRKKHIIEHISAWHKHSWHTDTGAQEINRIKNSIQKSDDWLDLNWTI